ncbi:hypothetical protein ASD77_04040 [Pseudoxanthomonas sp. Root65]|uniref:hypothetical protein n=1 Tax=Pseudoxanthomonas sp. Root65 TaxID=1736576 RepID=UPI0006F46DE6|nr:hypothetical protein [Pseudoxanthomonas sp. Root65]KRA53824.1 hypothetical protein ASD77_04040 [Pseudoxanthomonas sp. Root65]
MPRALLPLLLALLTASPSATHAQSAAPPATPVTIYRCVAANGTVALRDSPCLKGEKQEVRAMQRPQDPPRAPAVAPPPATQTVPAPPPATTRVVYLTPPKPMYECTTPEGQVYTSDNGDGNPRWVPYGIGYSAYPAWPRSGGSVSGSVSIGNGNLAFQSGDRSRPRPPGGGHHPGPRPGPVFVPGGGWVRDTCHPLPQEEVCARLSDRRYEILRRYGAALPSDRRTLDLEQRGIDARLANECR